MNLFLKIVLNVNVIFINMSSLFISSISFIIYLMFLDNDIVSEALHYYLLQSTQYFTIPQTIRCKPRQFGGLKKV